MIRALIKKEIRVLCASPILPVTGALFLFLTGIAFTATLTQRSFSELPEASVRGMVYFMAMVLLFISPFLTMRSFAEEKKTGTIELLKTSPLSDLQIVLAKYLVLLILLALLLALTIEFPLFLFWTGDPDPLPMALAYTGLFLLGSAFLAIGVFMSSLTKSQMLAAILTFVTTITLWFLEEVGGKFGAKVSIIAPIHSFGLGVFDLTDLAYYLLVIFLFLFLTVRVLAAERKPAAKTIGLSLAVAAACLLIFAVLDRRPVRWDLTQDRDFCLSEQTLKVLDELKADIKITAFFRHGEDYDDVFIRRRVDDTLREYATHSRRISYRLVDPDREPDAAIQYNINSDGTVVFESGTHRKEIFKSKLFDYKDLPEDALPQFVGEGLFTNTLLSVLGGVKTTICLIKGHGERSPEDTSPSGLSQFRQYLLNNNYELKDLSFIATAKVPPECRLLLLAGSTGTAELAAAEDRLIRDWVMQGGRLFLLLEPMRGELIPETLKALHVRVNKEIVQDPDRHFVLGPQYPAPLLTEHPITNGLESMNPILNSACSLSFEGSGGDFVLTPLLTTSDNATGGNDIKGPLTLGLIAQKKGSEEPVAVVLGDSDVISNALIQAPGNLDLTLNMVGWLVGDKNQVTIRPKSQRFRNLTLTKGRRRFISIFTQFVYPLAVLLVGGLFWFRRRKS